MASIYDKASLVMIPSGTKTSKIFSQKPVSGDGDFTFSRSTAATRVNASGNIEKETQNLFAYSDMTSGITLDQITRTTGQADPFGGNDAIKITESTTTTNHRWYRLSVTPTGVYTASFYAKYDSRKYVRLYAANQGLRADFNLIDGTIDDQHTGNIDATMVSVGNGWYRCSFTGNGSGVNWIGVYLLDDSRANSYTGDGTSSTFLYGFQIEQGLVARDYIETTTTAVEGGITDNVPRLDYTDSSCPALLLEPQRTNLIPHSEFTSGYLKHNVTWTYNDAESPEGVDNALKSTFSGSGYFGDNVSVTAGTTYTFSLYLKGDANKSCRIYIDGSGSGGYFFTQKQILLDGTWTRYELTYTIPAGATTANFIIQNYSWGGHTAVTELYSYGLQIEAGSYATSYIPTYGSAVTRNADACSKTGVSSIIGQAEGTLFIDAIIADEVDTEGYYFRIDQTSYSNTILFSRSAAGNALASLRVGGSTIFTMRENNIPDRVKLAFAYKSGDSVLYMNGSEVDSSSATYTMAITLEEIRLGSYSDTTANMSGGINQALVFKTRLSNEELADLTTL